MSASQLLSRRLWKRAYLQARLHDARLRLITRMHRSGLCPREVRTDARYSLRLNRLRRGEPAFQRSSKDDFTTELLLELSGTAQLLREWSTVMVV